jgi:predicted site-specific integrase-resolvase
VSSRKVQQRYLTTGQVAEHCEVSRKTAIGWMESGILPSSRLPGSRWRRVEAEALRAFCREHGMREPGEEGTE